MNIFACLFLLLAGFAMGEEDGGKPSLAPAAKAIDRAILHAEQVGKDTKKQARLSRLKQSLQKIAAGGNVDEARERHDRVDGCCAWRSARSGGLAAENGSGYKFEDEARQNGARFC